MKKTNINEHKFHFDKCPVWIQMTIPAIKWGREHEHIAIKNT
jgi:hypothetical protein